MRIPSGKQHLAPHLATMNTVSGLSCTPSVFQCLINNVLKDILGKLIIADIHRCGSCSGAPVDVMTLGQIYGQTGGFSEFNFRLSPSMKWPGGKSQPGDRMLLQGILLRKSEGLSSVPALGRIRRELTQTLCHPTYAIPMSTGL